LERVVTELGPDVDRLCFKINRRRLDGRWPGAEYGSPPRIEPGRWVRYVRRWRTRAMVTGDQLAPVGVAAMSALPRPTDVAAWLAMSVKYQ
jgi:hypothetical protein